MYIIKINNKIYSSNSNNLNLNKITNINDIYLLINNKFIKLLYLSNNILNITEYGSKIFYYNIKNNILKFNNVIYFMIVYKKNNLRYKNYNIQNNILNNKLILCNAFDTINIEKYDLFLYKSLNKNIIDKQYINNAIFQKKKYYTGKLGVALSHINTWNKFKFLPNKWALIMEDDCFIIKDIDIDAFINNCILEIINIKPKCKYIKLYINNFNKNKQFNDSNHICGNIYKPIIPNCSNIAYLLHQDGINIINKYLFPLKTFFDHSISYLFDHLNAVVYKNDIFKNMGADFRGDNNTLFGSIIFDNSFK